MNPLRDSLELEDVFLLLVVQRHLAHGVLQADGDLAVVGDSLTGALLVLIESHLLLVDHTVHVVPRPAGTESEETRAQMRHCTKCTYCTFKESFWTIRFDSCEDLTRTCLKPSCCDPPTRVCGAGSPPAGTWACPAGSWPAASPPGCPCPCETHQETPRGWAPTPRSPPRPRPRSPGNRRERQRTDPKVTHEVSNWSQTLRSCESVIRAATCGAEQNHRPTQTLYTEL